MTLLAALAACAALQLVALVVYVMVNDPVTLRGHEIALPAFTVQESDQ